MEKLSLLEKLSISSKDFPVYVGGYERCVVIYYQTKRSNATEVRFDLLPEDAVFIRNVYLKKDVPMPPNGHPAAEKVKRLENLGLLERVAGEVKIANRGYKANYTFIPR
ncbi:MAG: hypothetical protein AABX64_01720 [Nanoarchaeota archaeon]